MTATDAVRWARAVAADTRTLRVDAAGTKQYAGVRWPAELPAAPYAVHLAHGGLVRTLALDLDGVGGDPVADAALLCGLLDGAGVRYLVAASRGLGSPRRHVLATFPAGVGPAEVRALGRALVRLAPSLDVSQLSGSRTAAIRPPYSPHAAGGCSVPLGDAEAGLAALEAGNPPAAFSRLCELADVTAADRARPAPRPGDRLEVPRRPAPAAWLQVLRGGAGAQLARRKGWPSRSEMAYALTVRLVGCGWSRAEVAAAMTDPGNAAGDRYRRAHLGRGVYLERRAVERDRLLTEDFGRALGYVAANRRPAAGGVPPLGLAVAAAAGLAAAAPGDEPDRAELAATAELAAAAAELAGEDVRATVTALHRWLASAPLLAGNPDGAGAVLKLVSTLCRTAVNAGTLDLACAIRTLSRRAGPARSPVARLLRALAAAGVVQLIEPHAGTRAAVYRLCVPPVAAAVAIPGDLARSPAGVSAGQGARDGVGTLALPPGGSGWAELVAELDRVTDVATHPLFDHAGMGPGAGAVVAWTPPDGVTTDQLAALTGQTTEQIGQYVRFCTRAGVLQIDADGLVRRTRADLDQLAEDCGAAEVVRRRHAAYDAESAAWAWYCADYAARRGWAVERAAGRARRGGREVPAAQHAIPGLPPTLGHYPRVSGRACHVEALAAVRGHLAAVAA